jgi:hypothetical protein
MKDGVIKDPFSRGLIQISLCLCFIGFGVFCILKPDSVRDIYMKNFDLGSEFRWTNPRTYLRKRPPLIFYRILGLFMSFAGIFGLLGVLGLLGSWVIIENP